MNMLFAIDEVEALGQRLYESLSISDLNRIERYLQALGEENWKAWCSENAAIAWEILARHGEPLRGYRDVDRRRLTYFLVGKLQKTAALLNTDFNPVKEAKNFRSLVEAASAVVESFERSHWA